MGQAAHAEQLESRWNWLLKISGLASLILGVFFLLGLTRLIAADQHTIDLIGWLAPLPDNWLVILFKLNAGLDGVVFNSLTWLNPLDIAILVLVAVLNFGLYVVLRQTNRIWSLIAAILPVLGIILFLATKIAGRSAVMVATLIISLVMLRNDLLFSRATAYVGLLASTLLLVGDIGTNPTTHSYFIASLVGTGYFLLMVWYFIIGSRFLRFGQGELVKGG